MGIVVYLDRKGDRIYGLSDPTGGSFDAAGDFDRLLPTDAVAYPVLSQVDAYDNAALDHTVMPRLIREIDRLLASARPGSEKRGLVRLRALAQHCAEDVDVTMTFAGD